jgi:heat shock factor-binding protein 1
MDSRKIAEDPNTKELNQFVQNMLKQMQERFDEMSSNIIGRVDEMGKRIDDIEKSIGEIMNDLGEDEDPSANKK